MAKHWAVASSFQVGWRTVSVRVSALRSDTGAPCFEIHWLPEKPDRLRGPEFAQYDSGIRHAKQQLLAQLAGAPRST